VDKPAYLTPQDAAEELNVSVDTIRRAYRSTDPIEALPVLRVGLTVRIRRVDLERWIERHMSPPLAG
jgi:excisionase family DNA binding protein